MTITYRTSGAWGPGKGANLTAAEVDGNFHDLATRVTAVEANPAQPAEIAGITSSGAALTVTMSNGSTYGPLPLPSSTFRYREQWLAVTAYEKNDIVQNASRLYYIAVAHTSDATFSAGRTIGGVTVYQLMLQADEVAVDAVAAALASGTHTALSFAYNDAAGSISGAVNLTATDTSALDRVGTTLAAGTHYGMYFDYNASTRALSGGIDAEFLMLNDVPGAYTGAAGHLVAVNASGDGLEFRSPLSLVTALGTPRFMGAQVHLAATTASLNISGGYSIPFTAETFDTDGFHDLGATNTRLTIPSGLGIRKVRLSAALLITATTAGADNFISIRKNGADGYLGSGSIDTENSAATSQSFAVSTGVVSVVPGDFFELFVRTSDTSVILNADRTSLTLEVVEVEGGINIANVQTDPATSRTLTVADINAHLVFSAAAPVSVTVPAHAGVALPVGASLDIEQGGGGQVSVLADAGVTINTPAGRAPATAGQHCVLRLRKVALDTWTLFGDLA